MHTMHVVQRVVTATLFGLTVSFSAARTGRAQNTKAAEVGVTQQGTREQRMAQYGIDKKNEPMAFVMGMVWPTWGTGYAGNASRGTIPMIIMAGSVALFTYGASKSSVGTLELGTIGLTVGQIWGGVASYNTATDYNEHLKKQLGIQ